MKFTLGAWLLSPGFGGAAAVVAASVAFYGTWLNRRSEERRAREGRWWDQARWATDLLLKDDDDAVGMGIAALEHLLDKAPDVEAADFAATAMEPLIFDDEIYVFDSELMDASQPDEAESRGTQDGGALMAKAKKVRASAEASAARRGQKTATGVVISKKDANRIAAAKVYVKARKRTGKSVPDWVEELAGQPR